MSLKYLTNINLNKNELQNFRVQSVTTLPEAKDSVAGQLLYQNNKLWLFNGTKWVDASSQGDYTFKDGISEDSDRNVTLDKATTTAIGGVIVGDNIDVSSGTISVKKGSKSDFGLLKVGTNLSVTDSVVDVPAATSAALGVVTQGTNVTIDANGAVNVATGSKSALGVVKVGDNLDVTDGVVSVPKATSSALGVVTQGTNVSIDSDGKVSVATAGASTLGLVKVAAKATSNLTLTEGGALSVDPATTTAPGVVQVGSNVNVASGVISVTDGAQGTKGVVALATDTEASAGESKAVAATPAGVASYVSTAIANKIELTSLSIDSGSTNYLGYDNTTGKFSAKVDTTVGTTSTNLVTSGAVSTELAKKVDANEAITGATKCKITYDAKGLVTAGADLAAADIPDISATYVTQSQLGVASVEGGAVGVATLGTDGLVPAAQLPSYVDDVIEGYYDSTTGKFYSDSAKTEEITPEKGKIYVDLTTNKVYRWSGSTYVCVSNPLDLASESEAQGGTENTKVMTSLRVRQATNYWGENTAATLKSKTIAAGDNTISGLQTSNFGEYAEGKSVIQTSVRSATDASDSAIPTEKAVRSALSEVVGGAVHRFTATNPALSPSSGIVTWTISSTGLDADVEVQIKEVATGDYVFADVTSSTAGTVVIKFNASADVAKDTYKAIITGVNS